MSEAVELTNIPARTSNSPLNDRLRTEQGQTSSDDGHQVEPFAHYALPPVDGGRRAWLFLIAATVVEILIWGLPFSVGVLHVYWTNTLFAGVGASTVTLAATLQTGLLYMSCALFGPLVAAFPRWQKAIQVGGLAAASLSLIGSAFATQPWHLVVTIGCIYPLAGAFYLPCATLLFEWFHARRGLASGIMYAGTGAGGTVFPFIMSGLLNGVGYKAAMISLGVAFAIIGSIALIPIQRRVPLPRYDRVQTGRRSPEFNWGLLKSTNLAMGLIVILMTSLGNFIPSLWLPSYADDLNLTNPSGTALIALLNAASVPGNALLGYLSDHFPLAAVIGASCLGTALSCAFLWGFGTNSGMLVAFAIVFGLLGPSFSAVWSKMIGRIAKDDPVAPTVIFSLFSFTRGIGNITSGPVSDALLKISALKGATGAYGYNNYGILLVYTAVTILSGGAAGLMFRNH